MPGSKNVVLLMLSQACFNASNMTVVAFGSLAGALLADNVALATLPVAASIISNALSTMPMSFFMARFGRTAGFRLGATLGTVGGLLAAYSVYMGSFWMLVASLVCVGPFLASAQYYRFAAGESVEVKQVPKAISYVLIGGLVAALIVPTAAAFFNELFAPHTMMGVFVFLAIASLLALVPIHFLKGLQKASYEVDVGEKEAAVTPDAAASARPLRMIIRQKGFAVAVLNAAIGYGIMTGVMTATPLAMKSYDFNSFTSSMVIQSHVIAMYLPSLFTGYLIQRLGVVTVLLLGQLMFAAALVTTLNGVVLDNFYLGLVFLGVGWNFCFIGGTSLLTKLHRPSERGKVQGLNELLVFGMSASASFASGFVLRYLGWDMLNRGAFILLVVASIVTLVYALKSLRSRQEVAAE